MTAARSHTTRACATGVALLALAAPSCARPAPTPPVTNTSAATSAPPLPRDDTAYAPQEELVAPVSQLVNDAVAEPRLPGAVVRVGHAGKVVFHRAFGARKLAGEPGLDELPSPAEPMTEDTIFDLASLTKSLGRPQPFCSSTNRATSRSTIPCRRICRSSTRTTTPGAPG